MTGLLALLILVTVGAGDARAQGDVRAQARAEVAAGRRPEALRVLEAHLERAPGDVDARLLYGQILSWEGRYDDARVALLQVLDQTPTYLDGRVALMNVEWWSGRREEALALATQIITRDPGHQQARLVLQRISERDRVWSVSLSGSRDTFRDTFDPWGEQSVSVGRQTPAGSVIVRGSRATRFGSSDEMVELEFYPSFRAGTYGFVGVGVSPSHALYPERRVSADLYQSLGRGFEVSAGFRHLQFQEATWIYVGTLTKYVGNWMATGKVFHVPDRTVGGSWSYHGQLRRYFGSRGTSFVGVGGSHGLSRDDPRGLDDIMQTGQTARGQFQVDVSRRVAIFGSGSLTRQERVFRVPQWQTSLSTGLTIRF